MPFRPLSHEVAERIAAKELSQLLERRGLTERSVFVVTHPGAARRMADEAFDPRDGARSVKRYLEREVGTLLAEELASSPASDLRIVRLYAATDGYRLHVRDLVEAEARPGEYPLLPLLHAPAGTLRTLLPEALSWLDELLHGDALEGLSARIRHHLEHFETDAAHADAVYTLDTLRHEISAFREHVATWVEHRAAAAEVFRELEVHSHRRMPRHQGHKPAGFQQVRLLDRRWLLPPTPRTDKDSLLRALAETRFLRSLLPGVEDERRHLVELEITAVAGQRSSFREEDLFQVLTSTYASLRGEVLELATLALDGTVKEVQEPGEDDLLGTLSTFVRRAVLRISGLGVLDFFSGERGCHLWSSEVYGAQLVQVAVRPGTWERSAREVLEARRDEDARFEEALERGDEVLPADPTVLLPAVRKIRWEPPARPGEAEVAEVEDFRLAWADALRVRGLEELVELLVFVHMSRVEDAP